MIFLNNSKTYRFKVGKLWHALGKACMHAEMQAITFRMPPFSRSASTAEAAATMPQWPKAMP